MRLLFASGFGLLLAGCGTDVVVEPPPGEVLLYVDTDAPVPKATDARLRPDEPIPLFDRLRIEIFAPGADTPCDGCVNEFPVDVDRFRDRRASVGIALPPGVDGFRARVRMFFSEHRGADGAIDSMATMETVVALPRVAAVGKVEASVVLHADDTGVPVGTLDEPAAAAVGPVVTSLVGTWFDGARTTCSSPPRAGEVCVPGGAFWMGGRRGSWTFIPHHDTLRPRIVVLSPFFIDANEVTVARFRTDAARRSSVAWSGAVDGEAISDYCTYTDAPGAKDDYPVNCLTWNIAKGWCSDAGGDLLSEAQFEYVASGVVGATYVWGEDVPACTDAVFSRTGYGLFDSSVTDCKPTTPPGGPERVGSGARDRLVLPTGTIFDIGGNVAEWTSDRWNRFDEGCWSTPGPMHDPVCDSNQSTDGPLRTCRGGDWFVSGQQLARTIRFGAEGLFFYSPEVGFRCARADAPP